MSPRCTTRRRPSWRPCQEVLGPLQRRTLSFEFRLRLRENGSWIGLEFRTRMPVTSNYWLESGQTRLLQEFPSGLGVDRRDSRLAATPITNKKNPVPKSVLPRLCRNSGEEYLNRGDTAVNVASRCAECRVSSFRLKGSSSEVWLDCAGL